MNDKTEQNKLIDQITGQKSNEYEIECRVLLAKALGSSAETLAAMEASIEDQYNTAFANLRPYAERGAYHASKYCKTPAGKPSVSLLNHIGSNLQHDLEFPMRVAKAFGRPTKPLEDIARAFFDRTLSDLRTREDGAGVWIDQDGAMKQTHYSWADTAETQMAYELMQMARAAIGAGLSEQESGKYLREITQELMRMYTPPTEVKP